MNGAAMHAARTRSRNRLPRFAKYDFQVIFHDADCSGGAGAGGGAGGSGGTCGSWWVLGCGGKGSMTCLTGARSCSAPFLPCRSLTFPDPASPRSHPCSHHHKRAAQRTVLVKGLPLLSGLLRSAWPPFPHVPILALPASLPPCASRQARLPSLVSLASLSLALRGAGHKLPA